MSKKPTNSCEITNFLFDTLRGHSIKGLFPAIHSVLAPRFFLYTFLKEPCVTHLYRKEPFKDLSLNTRFSFRPCRQRAWRRCPGTGVRLAQKATPQSYAGCCYAEHFGTGGPLYPSRFETVASFVLPRS
jgi:hypothetical protein